MVIDSRPYSKGLCEGIEYVLRSMKTGGKRRVIIPPSLGFGSKNVEFGPGLQIPPSATLDYIIEVDTVYCFQTIVWERLWSKIMYKVSHFFVFFRVYSLNNTFLLYQINGTVFGSEPHKFITVSAIHQWPDVKDDDFSFFFYSINRITNRPSPMERINLWKCSPIEWEQFWIRISWPSLPLSL